MIVVRTGRKLVRTWVARHEKDGLDEWKISTFVKSQYILGGYEREDEDVAVFRFRFQKRGGAVMRATLWVRERRHKGIVELVVYRGHVEPVESQD